ncbi:recombination and repair protein [compost metagenome]
MADEQYLIEKVIQDERTITKVEALTRDGRVLELARMLGGVEITDKTLHHAQDMLDLGMTQKASFSIPE